MEFESNLSVLAKYKNNFINTVRGTITIATALVMPYQTMTMLLMARPPLCVKLNKADILKLQCKLCVLNIKIKPPIFFKSRFLKSPSYKDNSDESCYLNLKIHRKPATIALHLYVDYKNITFKGKPYFVLFLDNLKQNVASSLERKKSKSFKDIFNLFEIFVSKIYVLKKKEKYTTTQRDCGGYGSVKDTNANAFINVVKYKFTVMLFFREMSDNTITVPMEVEEGGIDAYMSDFQGMLDRLDNPSEVSGVGVGSCAGDVHVERESNAMGRDGGIEDGKAKPVPVSTSTCPEPRSDIESFEGFKSNLPRDERGCVTEIDCTSY